MKCRILLTAVVLVMIVGCSGQDRSHGPVGKDAPVESADWTSEIDVAVAGSAVPEATDEAMLTEGDAEFAWDVGAMEGADPFDSAPPPPPPIDDRPTGNWREFNAVVETAPGVRSSPRSASATRYDVAETVDEIVERLRDGGMVYNAPSTMQFGEPTDMELLISPTQSTDALITQLRDSTNARSDTLQIGNRMEASLTGAGFSIEPLSPELQAVSGSRPTRWRWRVTPTQHGRQELHLSVAAHLDIDGRDTPYVVETKDAVIEVDITVGQQVAAFVGKYWQWLWAAVIVPVCGFGVRKRKRANDKTVRRAAA
ncbi:MAG: hypothetical protein KF861_11125 [Planctomycetaceae bacterium]|nr:hypothetical protein [Planctomycetaceae bacterium]